MNFFYSIYCRTFEIEISQDVQNMIHKIAFPTASIEINIVLMATFYSKRQQQKEKKLIISLPKVYVGIFKSQFASIELQKNENK
jgi:hypothetical protein